MTSRQILKGIYDTLVLNGPDTPITTTVDHAQGSTITTHDAIGANDIWEGGLVEMYTGDAQYDAIPIASNTNREIYLSSWFSLPYTPKAGDTMKISKGPLGEAFITQFTLDGMYTDQIINGYSSFIGMEVISQEDMQVTLGKDARSRNSVNMARDFLVVLMVECKKLNHTDDDVANYRELTKLEVLTSQVLARVHWYRANIAKGVQAPNDDPSKVIIKTDFEEYSRPGIDTPIKSAMIEFWVRLRR